jgi:malonyl-CoA decarboxylase
MHTPNFLKRFFGSTSNKPGVLSAAAARQTKQGIARCRALLSERGEASGATLAREALAAYQTLEGAALKAYFDVLVEEFSPDPELVGRTADAYRKDPSQTNLIRLQQVVEAPRQELFRRLNMAPGGTAALVEMRRRILRDIKAHSHWAGIESVLANLLSSWFNRGFLTLERIDWHTSAIVLEKLIQYEAVHEIQGWSDLRRRLQTDRRCYAFFHPTLPKEPVIFIEVALTRGMSAKVQPLLDPESAVSDASRADGAIFYSITNCQEGLRGISFGNFLIKQVAEDLGREFPRVKTFATLSPIPGFRKWLVGQTAQREAQASGRQLAQILERLQEPDWFKEKGAGSALQKPLSELCACYLVRAKQGDEPLDPVARFHLSNGARMERINWLGDTSEAGMFRSAGLMVNYVYKLADVERNHEAYVKEHKIIASSRLESMANDAPFAAQTAKRK